MKSEDIENNTLISEKNIKFITKLRMNTLPIIVYRIIVVLLGLFFLMVSVANLDVPHPNYSTVLFYFLLGFIFIVFAIWGLKLIYYKKSLKSSDVNILEKIVFKKDKVIVKAGTNDVNITNEFLYSAFVDMIINHDDFYYLKLKNKNQYLIIDMNGFNNEQDKELVNEYLKNNNKKIKK